MVITTTIIIIIVGITVRCPHTTATCSPWATTITTFTIITTTTITTINTINTITTITTTIIIITNVVITQVSSYYSHLLSLGDRRVESWPLMASPMPTLALTFAYLLVR